MVSEYPSPGARACRVPLLGECGHKLLIAFAGYNPAPWDGKRRFSLRGPPLRAACRMLALFLAIALLGTDGAYGRSTTDLTGDNHDNTDLGRSELHAKAGAYSYGGGGAIDFSLGSRSRLTT